MFLFRSECAIGTAQAIVLDITLTMQFYLYKICAKDVSIVRETEKNTNTLFTRRDIGYSNRRHNVNPVVNSVMGLN